MKGDAGEEQDPIAVASKVQEIFSNSLLTYLKKAPVPVTHAPLGENTHSPVGTLIVRGDFTTVKEGNKTRRMMIGLGSGVSDVQAHVMITLITADGPIMLSEFTVDAKSSKKPGAAATMGYGAAVDVATGNKSSVEADTLRMLWSRK